METLVIMEILAICVIIISGVMFLKEIFSYSEKNIVIQNKKIIDYYPEPVKKEEKKFIEYYQEEIIPRKKVNKYIDTSNLEKKNVFTYAEREFYGKLKNCLSEKYILLSKVRICDFVGQRHKTDYWTYAPIFQKINRKHIDFVIADTKGDILLLIELDGFSHTYGDTIENDRMKEELFENVGIPLLRFRNGTFNFEVIHKILEA